MTRGRHVIIVGAGIGGLAAAYALAADGFRVSVVEKSPGPGGKMREVIVGGLPVASGPTVLTMRWIFEELFSRAGEKLDEHLVLKPCETLARHFWLDGSRLDLFANPAQSQEAIRQFAGGREAAGFRRFCTSARRMYETLDQSFMRVEKPSPAGLVRSLGATGVARLLAVRPFTTLWRELGHYFRDPRLRQLFARYATYCGSSPWQAPATLALIAHVEQAGVWRVAGGIQRLAEALTAAAMRHDATIRFDTKVESVLVSSGKAAGVRLADGEVLPADAVIFNGDVAALTRGLLGEGVSQAVPARDGEPRSLSALTWCTSAPVGAYPLVHHNVFFGDDYEDEFRQIFEHRAITRHPTVYVCAHDRGDSAVPRNTAERLLLLVNAPAVHLDADDIARYTHRARSHLAGHGFSPALREDASVLTCPGDFARLFPGSDGALYGWPTHGWSGSFRRWGARSRVPGLYLAGGSVHPGPGVPMVALSGSIAARAVRNDLTGA